MGMVVGAAPSTGSRDIKTSSECCPASDGFMPGWTYTVFSLLERNNLGADGTQLINGIG